MNGTQISLLIAFFICCLLFILFNEKRPLLNLDNDVGYINNRVVRKPLLLITVFLILIALFRNQGMADYQGYKYLFETKHEFERSEPFFTLVRKLAQISPWPWFVGSLIIATIGISLKVSFIKKYSPVVWGSMLVYLSYLYVAQDLIAIRSACASAMLLPILESSAQRDFKRALLFCLAAACFHTTALVFLPLVLLNKDKGYRWFYIGCVILSYYLASREIFLGKLVALLEFKNAENHYAFYSLGDSVNIFNLIQIFRLLICLLSWIFYKKMHAKYPQMLLYLKAYTIGIVLFVLFSDIISIAIRLQELFLVVEIILIPCLFYSVFGRKKILSKIAVISYAAIALFLITLNNPAYWHP